MKRADKLILAARIFDAVYQTTLMQEKDNNPEHWKTINGAKVHLDKNGKYDGGAGGKFNGDYHFGGHDWKQKKADMENLANVFKQVTAQKQAQANAQASNPGNATQNVAPKATQNAGNGGIIKTEQEYETEILNAKQEYKNKLADPHVTRAEKKAAFDKVKAIGIEAAEQGHVIVHECLQNSVATPEQIDAIKTHLKNAPTEIRALWNIYSSEVGQDLDRSQTTKTISHYDNNRMIHMDLNEANKKKERLQA